MANTSIYNAFERFWTHVVNALNGKSNTGHTHDDRYYTEAEVDEALSGKSDTGHKHAPADITGVTATVEEINYLDGVKSGIQAQLDSKAASSHGAHVTYGTSASAVGATASAGTASTVSRSDHTHSLSKAAVTTALGYTPPTTNTTYNAATASALGLVKSGTDISVDSSGNVTVVDNSHKHTVSNISDLTATAAELNKMDGVTATTAEINHLVGVTSGIQGQLDSKAASSHNHSAANITSGTLAVARGGTGATTATEALTKLGAASQTDLDALEAKVDELLASVVSVYSGSSTDPSSTLGEDGDIYLTI